MAYLGSKGSNGVWQRIVGSMPPHDVYIEAFLGSGVVMKRKPSSVVTIGIEIDASTVAAHDYPADATVIEGCAFEHVPSLVAGARMCGKKVLVYVDAPYHPDTRTSNKKYRHDFTSEDHIRLLEMLLGLDCQIIVSHYPHPLYDSALADWRRWEFDAMTRGGVRREVIYMNYAEGRPSAADMVGRDYEDRRRIKRKASRWARMLATMPPGEREAVFAACCGAMENT